MRPTWPAPAVGTELSVAVPVGIIVPVMLPLVIVPVGIIVEEPVMLDIIDDTGCGSVTLA